MMLPQEFAEMHALAGRLIAADVSGVLATLFWAEGSTYRRLGSMMVCGLSADMKCGGVSGGCLEDYIIRRGHELLRTQPAAMLSFSSDPLSQQDGAPTLGCGGKVEVLIERLTAQHLPMLQAMAKAAHADEASIWPVFVEMHDALVTKVMRPLQLDPIFHDTARAALVNARSQMFARSQRQRTLLQFVAPLRRLVVFGAGPDAMPLVTMAKLCGWHITVADRRVRLAIAERFPEADQVLSGAWPELCEQIQWSAHSAAVVMTHSFDDDLILVPELAALKLPYVGLLGPAQRRDRLLREIARESELAPLFLENLHAPVGLPLGDRNSPGIAVAIIAEILRHFSNQQLSAEEKSLSLASLPPALCYA
jgi:xanthine dehydrogenase accessory factor